jgi:beta-phosphoglucomutase-like phosphatase (HAD superfamily)
MAYGLTKDGVLTDREWFWQEVWLRAGNNYGPWKTRDDIFGYIETAIRDICLDTACSKSTADWLVNNNTKKITKIADDMEELS